MLRRFLRWLCGKESWETDDYVQRKSRDWL